MTSSLAWKCCCPAGCGCETGCPGNFFAGSVTLTFTPHWFCGWCAGNYFGCGPCADDCWDGVNPTDCDEVAWGIGALPSWYESTELALTCDNATADSSCYAVLESAEQSVALPIGLPAFTANPIGASSASADWCSLGTSRAVWGAGGKYLKWKARVYLKALQCDAAGSGADVNTIIAVAQILLDDDVVWARNYYSVGGSDKCSCFSGGFGAAGASWTVQCDGADCDDWAPSVEAYHGGVKWPVYGGLLHTEAFAWQTSRTYPACSALSGTLHFYGCSDATTPTDDCPDCDGPGPCGTGDSSHLFTMAFGPPPDTLAEGLSNSYHVGTYYCDGCADPCNDYRMFESLGFTTSGIPGFTDVSLSSIVP